MKTPDPQPSFTIDRVNIPGALFGPRSEDEADLIHDIEARLASLRLQRLGVDLASLFHQRSDLQEIVFFVRSFSTIDPHYRSLSMASNLGLHNSCDGFAPDERAQAVAKEICPDQRLRSRNLKFLMAAFQLITGSDPISLDAIDGIRLHRPSRGDPLPAVMSRVLPPADFACWEAAWIRSAAPQPQPLDRSRPSL